MVALQFTVSFCTIFLFFCFFFLTSNISLWRKGAGKYSLMYEPCLELLTWTWMSCCFWTEHGCDDNLRSAMFYAGTVWWAWLAVTQISTSILEEPPCGITFCTVKRLAVIFCHSINSQTLFITSSVVRLQQPSLCCLKRGLTLKICVYLMLPN